MKRALAQQPAAGAGCIPGSAGLRLRPPPGGEGDPRLHTASPAAGYAQSAATLASGDTWDAYVSMAWGPRLEAALGANWRACFGADSTRALLYWALRQHRRAQAEAPLDSSSAFGQSEAQQNPKLSLTAQQEDVEVLAAAATVAGATVAAGDEPARGESAVVGEPPTSSLLTRPMPLMAFTAGSSLCSSSGSSPVIGSPTKRKVRVARSRSSAALHSSTGDTAKPILPRPLPKPASGPAAAVEAAATAGGAQRSGEGEGAVRPHAAPTAAQAAKGHHLHQREDQPQSELPKARGGPVASYLEAVDIMSQLQAELEACLLGPRSGAVRKWAGGRRLSNAGTGTLSANVAQLAQVPLALAGAGGVASGSSGGGGDGSSGGGGGSGAAPGALALLDTLSQLLTAAPSPALHEQWRHQCVSKQPTPGCSSSTPADPSLSGCTPLDSCVSESSGSGGSGSDSTASDNSIGGSGNGSGIGSATSNTTSCQAVASIAVGLGTSLDGSYALHAAAAAGRADVIEQLLRFECDPNHRAFVLAPLMADGLAVCFAAEAASGSTGLPQDEDWVAAAIAQEPIPCPLLLPAGALTSKALRSGAPLTACGATALHVAAAAGHAEAVKSLLQAPGCDVNARTAQGISALHVAAQQGLTGECVGSAPYVRVANTAQVSRVTLAALR
jgi:hypothetical protein